MWCVDQVAIAPARVTCAKAQTNKLTVKAITNTSKINLEPYLKGLERLPFNNKSTTYRKSLSHL